jgi:hypothetical protein
MNLKFLSWQEGEHFDFWFLVHFLSGAAGGSILFLIGIPMLQALALALIAAIIWEIFEWKFLGVKERKGNAMVDIFTGVLGTFFSYQIVTLFVSNPKTYAAVILVEIVLVAVLSRFGWKNYPLNK